MHIFKEIAPLKAFLAQIKAHNKLIGFVPTMGALHKGHLTLIAESLQKTDITVCSIFVNPAQFTNSTDLQKYPRNLSRDIEQLNKAGCDVLFCPDDLELYPHLPNIEISFKQLDRVLEGHGRPGHFSGVALIISKLFHIVLPDIAFFGQKDLQQCLIIKQLVQELNFDVHIRIVLTVRENDGLAMSSRNLRLNAEERIRAVTLFKALTLAKHELLEGKDWKEVKQQAILLFLAQHIKLEYFELVDFTNLEPISALTKAEHPVICVAAFVGEIRLIDNVFVKELTPEF
jgi:pantoate--beta-alanine ligase